MTQEEINDLRDKNCPPWLCDTPSDEALSIKVKKLEAENQRLREALIKIHNREEEL